MSSKNKLLLCRSNETRVEPDADVQARALLVNVNVTVSEGPYWKVLLVPLRYKDAG